MFGSFEHIQEIVTLIFNVLTLDVVFKETPIKLAVGPHFDQHCSRHT